MKTIRVGISDLNVVTSPHSIRTSGLGSCVGIVLYDKKNKIGGLSHIMLPVADERNLKGDEAKFADTAIPLLIKKIEKKGSRKEDLEAAIFGGAAMFDFKHLNANMQIGERNVEATKNILKQLNIHIKFEKTGGKNGRTVTLDSSKGIVHLRTTNSTEELFYF